jgi:hypothetical protein
MIGLCEILRLYISMGLHPDSGSIYFWLIKVQIVQIRFSYLKGISASTYSVNTITTIVIIIFIITTIRFIQY